MLAAARAAPRALPDGPRRTIRFVQAQAGPGGGFVDRAGAEDLYYTVFGLEALRALGAEPPAETATFLRGFGDGEGLDLIHLASLIRCWADLPETASPRPACEALAARLEALACPDGGYPAGGDGNSGTAYGGFLALGAWQDLGAAVPDPQGLARCLDNLRAGDGGYANDRAIPVETIPATAAAVVTLIHLGQTPPPAAGESLLSGARAGGGFAVADGVPAADLLSTAVALHALVGLGADLEAIRADTLDFVTGLQTEAGGFRGHDDDEQADCEYTWYALLALGHLSR